MRAPALDHARSNSFSAHVSNQSQRTLRSVATVTGTNLNIALSALYPNREFRAGTTAPPPEELARLQTDGFTLLHMMCDLARPRFCKEQSDNYLAFELFRPGMILNYNLDGLASYLCPGHRVITPHGTVDPWYGSPGGAEVLSMVREFDIRVSADGITLCVPESDKDAHLKSMLREAYGWTPEFIAVIGYSFGRNGAAYDDHVSWQFFSRAFPKFSGSIYVIDPDPYDLACRVADARKTSNVFGIRAFWNLLAHSFVETSYNRQNLWPLDYIYDRALDKSGNEFVCLR